MPTVLVTGANRGIGLEHVRQSLAAGEAVIACCRAPEQAAELHALSAQYDAKALRLEGLDVASGPSIEALTTRLAGVPVDILINNAGFYGEVEWPDGARHQSLEGMDYGLWEKVLRINLIGPFRITAALTPNLLAGEGKLVVMISSDLGSIAWNTVGMSHCYRSSKAGLNMVVRGLAADLKDRDVTVISLAPGWTQTALGGPDAEWPVADSVSNQRKVIAGVGPDDSGYFINLTGERLPW
jgi:NAD(P)-dependent dehydrogenase (short-subunit alcohol dehydrogenase family)